MDAWRGGGVGKGCTERWSVKSHTHTNGILPRTASTAEH
jgi:hypothetical protein